MRRIALLLVAMICPAISGAQSCTAAGLPKVLLPESGYVSPHQYTNAFFGFSLRLRNKGHFQIADLSEDDKPLHHFLFAERSLENSVTTLVVSATEVVGAADDEAEKAVFIPGTQATKGPEALSVSGRLFWKNELEQKTFSNRRLFRLRYATAVAGFVIQFSISSSDRKIVEELSDNIESIKFFDPVRISEVLGPDCSPFLPQAVRLRLTSAPHIDLARIGSGELRRNVYVNSSLGFLYHFPDGWYASDEAEASQRAVTQNPRILRTQSLQQASALAEPCTRILASARKNQPSSEEFSPRITILVADPTCFVPDLSFPISVQERSAVEAFGRSLIRAFSGTQLMGPGVSAMRCT